MSEITPQQALSLSESKRPVTRTVFLSIFISIALISTYLQWQNPFSGKSWRVPGLTSASAPPSGTSPKVPGARMQPQNQAERDAATARYKAERNRGGANTFDLNSRVPHRKLVLRPDRCSVYLRKAVGTTLVVRTAGMVNIHWSDGYETRAPTGTYRSSSAAWVQVCNFGNLDVTLPDGNGKHLNVRPVEVNVSAR